MNPSAGPVWVDHHLLLNAMSVLRHRMVTGEGEPVALLDAISGYLSSGLYVEKRGSVARVSWLLDWIECLAAVRDSVDPQGTTVDVVVDPGGDDDRSAHLADAADVARALLTGPPGPGGGRHLQLNLRLDDDRVHFRVSGADAGLSARWQALADARPPGAVRVEPHLTAGAVACSARLPAAG